VNVNLNKVKEYIMENIRVGVMQANQTRQGDLLGVALEDYSENRNLAEIEAVKLDSGNFQINRLKNFLSNEEISKKYGYYVLETYRDKNYVMRRINNPSEVTTVVIDDFENMTQHRFRAGTVLSPDQFQEIITVAKKAGSNFVESIKELRNKRIENVVI
jgi:hypothetical protein